jgi:hypothetical protein
MFANLGQQIGSGIQNYQKNKEERDIFETRALSNIGEYIEFNNRFKANPSAFGNTNPVSQKTLDELSAKKITNLSSGQLKAFVDQTEKLLQKPRAIESFIQQQALTDAANQQRNTRIAAAMTPPQANAPFYLGRPMQPDTPEALTKRVVEAGGSIQEALAAARAPSDIRKTEAETVALGSKQPALPSYQQQRLNTEVAAFKARTGSNPTPDQMAAIYNRIDEGTQPNPYAAKVAETLFNQYTSAQGALQRLESINDQIAMLDKGNVNVGFMGEIKTGIDKLTSAFGNKEAAERVTNTEILESVLGLDLMSAITAAGLTTRSFDTPAEMKNLRAAFVGGTTLSPESIKTIAKFRRGVLQTVVNDYNQKVDKGVYNRLSEAFGQPVEKIKLPIVIKSITPRK